MLLDYYGMKMAYYGLSCLIRHNYAYLSSHFLMDNFHGERKDGNLNPIFPYQLGLA